MRRPLVKPWRIALPLALALAAGPAWGQAGEDWIGLGKAVTLEISARQFDKAAARFDETMTAVLPAATLAATWEEWKAALARSPRATFKLYPGLYHLFMPSSTAGAGLGTPADYQRPAHVAAPVIDDVARWIAASAR
jgi:hypothetical protein